MRRLLHLSDLHFGRTDPPVAEALPAYVSALRADLVVISGDFTQRARAGQFREAAEFVRRLPEPRLVVPGNHDMPLYDLFTRMTAPLRNYRRYIARDLRPCWKDAELMVIGINTARQITWNFDGFWKDGKISAEQLLDIEMQARDFPGFKVVVTHHPFIPPPKERPHGIVHGAKRALATLEDAGVDLLLAGHLHMAYSGDVRTHFEAARRSMLSVQAGTAVSTRRRNEPNAFNLIEIDPGDVNVPPRVTVAVHAWAGGGFAETLSTRYVKRGGAWELESTRS